MEGEQAALPQVNAAPEVAEEQPQAEEAPAANGEAVAVEEPASEEAAAAEQPAESEQPAADGDQPAAEGEHKAEGDAEPAADGAPAGPEEQPKGTPTAPAAGPAPNRPPQVFFSGAPAGVKREEVEEVFGTYGKVVRVELLIDFATRQTRGSGFVRYSESQAAADAIAALHQNYTFPGGSVPMTVRWAGGTENADRKRKAPYGQPPQEYTEDDDRQLFLAKITRQIPEDAIAAVLGQYGRIEFLRMFKPTPDAVYHKGCGVVTYSTGEEADSAMRALDEVYVWDGMREAMIAKYNESEPNKRRREDELRSGPQYVSLEQPPQGCDPDALKMFVDGIPVAATVEDIRNAFKGFGRIIQILVARDKDTGEPKGSAYIWYQRRRDVDFAIRRMNGNTTAFAAMHAEADAAAAAEAGEEPKPSEPRKLVVKVAQSSVKTLRRGERPPGWMQQQGFGPGGGAPPLNMPPMRGPPGGGYGGPPHGAYGGPGYGAPMGGYGGHPMGGPPGGYGGYGQGGYGGPQGGYGGPQGGYGQGSYGAPQGYGAPPAQQGPPGGYQAPAGQPAYGAAPGSYQQAPGGYSPQPAPAQQPGGGYPPQAGQAPPAAGGYDANYASYYGQQPAQPAQAAPQAQPAQDAYAGYYAQQAAAGGAPQQAAPAGAGGYAYPQQGQPAPAQQGYYGAPAAQPAAAQGGAPQAQPVGGYGSYPGAAQQQGAPQQGYQQQAPAQQGYYGAPAQY